VRLNEILTSQRKLLRDLTGRISNRLESQFTELPGDGPNVGIELQERGRRVVMELPAALLLQADGDPSVQEAIRVRIKARRDRMLFRAQPAPLPKHIASAPDPGFSRFGSGRNDHGRGRR
jgi:regulator of protease activity HflC (stomatin/prohibitin superfamily)